MTPAWPKFLNLQTLASWILSIITYMESLSDMKTVKISRALKAEGGDN